MDRGTALTVITTCLSEVLERDLPGLAEETRLFDDLHLDSTSILELLMALEDTLGIEIDPENLDMADFLTVGTLTDYVLRNLATVPDGMAGVGAE
jgi:acyl carrier protein